MSERELGTTVPRQASTTVIEAIDRLTDAVRDLTVRFHDPFADKGFPPVYETRSVADAAPVFATRDEAMAEAQRLADEAEQKANPGLELLNINWRQK